MRTGLFVLLSLPWIVSSLIWFVVIGDTKVGLITALPAVFCILSAVVLLVVERLEWRKEKGEERPFKDSADRWPPFGL